MIVLLLLACGRNHHAELLSCEDLQQACLMEGQGIDPVTYDGPRLHSGDAPPHVRDVCWCEYQRCEAKVLPASPIPEKCSDG